MLRRMIEINSFTSNPEGVNRLGRLTAECFAPLGFAAEFVPSTNPAWGNHLVLTRRGRSARNIAMISHLDTVFPRKKPGTTSGGSGTGTGYSVPAPMTSKVAR